MNLGINLAFPVGNAAGWCKSVEEVRRVAQSAAEFIVVGSITLQKRSGNPGNTWNNKDLNSLGLPNPGAEEIENVAHEMVSVAHSFDKKIILSVAGFDASEYVYLFNVALKSGFDGVELNFGCPNVADDGKRKRIFSFYPELMHEVLLMLSLVDGIPDTFFVSVKVSPITNPQQIIELAEMFSQFRMIHAVVTQNTVPNCLEFSDGGAVTITTPDKTGYAGLSGPSVKAMALGQVKQWRSALDLFNREDIAVTGVGGVSSAKDVQDMIFAGASMVQIGTACILYGPKIFSDIASDYIS